MTRRELDEIRAAVLKAPIYRDKYGGEFVLAKDVPVYGARAIIHRKQLLEELERRDASEGITGSA
jgi:hypothetical protein